MATKEAHRRLTKELAAIKKNPPPYIDAVPLESNILEWFIVQFFILFKQNSFLLHYYLSLLFFVNELLFLLSFELSIVFQELKFFIIKKEL